MKEKKTILYIAIIIMFAVAIFVSVGPIYFLYHNSVEHEKEHLLEATLQIAQIVEGIHDKMQNSSADVINDIPHFPNQSVISILKKALDGKRLKSPRLDVNPQIQYIIAHKKNSGRVEFLVSPKAMMMAPVQFEKVVGKPMGMALSGKTGANVSTDHLGRNIVAAYTPIESLNWGLVSKIYLKDIHKAFSNALLFSAIVACLVICIGAYIMIRSLEPIVESINKAKQEALQASEAKSEFLANMSHEIRTPMNGINGMVDLVLGTALSHTQRKYLKMAKNSAVQLLDIINDILDFSKIEAGKFSLIDSEFSLRKIVNSALNVTELQIKQKNIQVNCRIDESIPDQFTGDPIRIRQILINLLGNALKFTEKGSIDLNVSIPDESSDLPMASSNEFSRIFFQVKDTGIGMSEKEQKIIFESFSQVDSSISRKHGGTGLGLSISARLIEMMNGKIWLESEPDKGTTFHFYLMLKNGNKSGGLPKKGTDPYSMDEQSAVTLSIPANLNILLIEDDIINAELAIALLARHGVIITHAKNGNDAIAFFKNAKYDLVLMDIQMPGVDGYTATKKMRKFEDDNDSKPTPIVAMTAHALKGDRDKCLDSGMDGYVSKPISENSLLQEVRSVLNVEDVDSLEKDTLIGTQSSSEPLDYKRLIKDMCYEKEDLAVKLIKMLIEERGPELIAELTEAVANKDDNEIRSICHTFKGTSANMCADRLAVKVEELGAVARSGEIFMYDQLLSEVKIEFQEVVEWWKTKSDS